MSTSSTEIPLYAHKQVRAVAQWGKEVNVDEGLKDLLEIIWRRGWHTQYSCQGGLEPGSESEAGGQAQPSQFTVHMMFGVMPQPSDAHIIFTNAYSGFSFLDQSMKLLMATRTPDPDFDGIVDVSAPDNPWYAALMNLQVLPGIDGEVRHRAMVSWLHTITPKLVEVWS